MEQTIQSRAGLRRTLGQVLAITGTTLIEAIQQPVAFLILLSAVLMTLLVPVFEFQRFSEDGRLARDSGLSCMLVFGLVLAAGTAGRSVAEEISRGTVAAVIGKPVSRVTFLLAKWLGVVAVVAVFWCGVLASTLVAERCSAHFVTLEDFVGDATDPVTLTLGFAGVAVALIVAAVRHYVWRRRFGVSAFVGVTASQALVALLSAVCSRFGQLFPALGQAACEGEHARVSSQLLLYHPALNLRVIPVALLVLFALAVFAALATALATRLQTGAALAVCATVLILGLAGDSLMGHAPLFSARGLAAGVLPDVQSFWLCDAVARGGRVAAGYVAMAGAYALTCCALCLTAGCWAFQERDLG